jgi:tryptophan 2,3-dioxygenase
MPALAVEIQTRSARSMVHSHRGCPIGAEPRATAVEPGPDRGTADGAAPAAASRVPPTYSEYLQLPALLGLQRPLGDPAVPDEMLFIVVHQTHELWFKQMLSELSRTIGAIDARDWPLACAALERTAKIVRLLDEHMSVLETMPPEEFGRFRAALGTASGLESEQFRRFERLAGSLPAGSRGLSGSGSERVASTSVREAFWRSLGEAPAPLVEAMGDREASQLGTELAEWLTEPTLEAQRGLARAMLGFDRQLVLWRRHHFEMARRMIGEKLGTGGSSGASYLRSTMDRRFFPELWSVEPR